MNQRANGESAMFSEVASWFEEVDGSELLDEIATMMKRYTVLSDNQAVAITLWVVFTWFHEQATVSPILNVSSPEKRCGKSTLLTLLTNLSFRVLTASNITPAAIFRAVDKWQPTLIIDEADTFLAKSDELRGMINSGHYKQTAFVIRCSGDDHEPMKYGTWGAKAIAGIGELPETIMDRSVVIDMKRKLPDQKIESIRRADESEFKTVKEKLARWSTDNHQAFKDCNPEELIELNDRANDNWEPLLAIAQLAGEEWLDMAINAAKDLSRSEAGELSTGECLLKDILEVFVNSGKDKMRTVEIIDALCSDAEKPWATIDYGKRITPYMLSRQLKPFGISPKDFRFMTTVKKGYHKADFDEAVKRYLPQAVGNEATSATEATGQASDGESNVIELDSFR